MATTRLRRRAGVLEYIDSTNEILYRASPMHFVDDFNQYMLATPIAGGSTVSKDRWAKKTFGTLDVPPQFADYGTNAIKTGGVTAALAATDEEEEGILYANNMLFFAGAQNTVVQMVLKLSVLPTLGAEAVWGMGSDYTKGPDDVRYNAFFTADGSGEVFCETDDNASDQSVTSGITVVAGAWHVYRIEFNAGGNTWFYIDGARVAAGTAFVGPGAAVALQPYVGVYKASSAGLAAFDLDKIDIWSDRS